MKLKFPLIFIFSVILGIVGVFFYHFSTTHPNEPVKNIIQNIAKPTFSIANAPSEAIVGTITDMSGSVQYESRTATISSAINSPVSLQQGESIETEVNGNVNVIFPNEAQIKILPKTKIDFIQTLPINFVVNIASGSAEISKEGNVPVTVRTLHLLVKIKSGSITASVDESNLLVTLEIISGNGVTVAYNDLNLSSHTIDFENGQKITFNDKLRMFE